MHLKVSAIHPLMDLKEITLNLALFISEMKHSFSYYSRDFIFPTIFR